MGDIDVVAVSVILRMAGYEFASISAFIWSSSVSMNLRCEEHCWRQNYLYENYRDIYSTYAFLKHCPIKP